MSADTWPQPGDYIVFDYAYSEGGPSTYPYLGQVRACGKKVAILMTPEGIPGKICPDLPGWVPSDKNGYIVTPDHPAFSEVYAVHMLLEMGHPRAKQQAAKLTRRRKYNAYRP